MRMYRQPVGQRGGAALSSNRRVGNVSQARPPVVISASDIEACASRDRATPGERLMGSTPGSVARRDRRLLLEALEQQRDENLRLRVRMREIERELERGRD